MEGAAIVQMMKSKIATSPPSGLVHLILMMCIYMDVYVSMDVHAPRGRTWAHQLIAFLRRENDC